MWSPRRVGTPLIVPLRLSNARPAGSGSVAAKVGVLPCKPETAGATDTGSNTRARTAALG